MPEFLGKDYYYTESGGGKKFPPTTTPTMCWFRRRLTNWMGTNNNQKKTTGIAFPLLLLSNVLFMAMAITFALLFFDKLTGGNGSGMPPMPQPSASLLGQYSTAAVAADNEICSNIGRDILLRGGNAVESAIATLFCIGVVDTYSSGLGGGHLMTIYNSSTKRCHVIDGREVAPLNSTEDMYYGQWEKAKYGWESVAVPGELHGLWTAYKNFGGNLEWHTLVHPTVKLMDEGYPTSHALALNLRKKEQSVLANPLLRKKFVNPKTGKLFAPGEQIKTRQNLADTLRKLAKAEDPVAMFYNGEMAKQMVEEFQANGGRLTLEDFARYKSVLRPDSDVIYTHLADGRTICGPPPPSGAAVAQGILNILAPVSFNMSIFAGTVDFLHRFIEASKFAYAVRNSLGDMDFVPNAMEIARNLTSPKWAQFVRSKMSWDTQPDAFYDNDGAVPASLPEDHGTAHISVIDRWGNAVSVTSTINLALGSLVMSESTGILWNDEMDDFSSPEAPNYWGYPPSEENFIRPGKRPMSSMSPIIVFNRHNDKEVLSIGGAGGSTIISGVAADAFHTLWQSQTIKQAIDFPRLHNQLRPNLTMVEKGMPVEYVDALRERGHTFEQKNWITVVTGAYRDRDGNVYANSDWRKGWESEPAGY